MFEVPRPVWGTQVVLHPAREIVVKGAFYAFKNRSERCVECTTTIVMCGEIRITEKREWVGSIRNAHSFDDFSSQMGEIIESWRRLQYARYAREEDKHYFFVVEAKNIDVVYSTESWARDLAENATHRTIVTDGVMAAGAKVPAELLEQVRACLDENGWNYNLEEWTVDSSMIEQLHALL